MRNPLQPATAFQMKPWIEMFPYNSLLRQICQCLLLLKREMNKTYYSSHLINPIILQVFLPKV